MDLGCLDLGCISVSEKQGKDAVNADSEKKDEDSPTSSRKNKVLKGTGLSAHTAVNKSYSQLKKPHRKGSSPLNWFPRVKVDSYLKRKIRLLQEVGGMTSTLDETLGDSNPHYSRVLREKIAAREAACQAMEARKAALVEASWCRILKAARIQSKEAEALLEKTEKTVVEAFEAAAALGVIMYDRPDCPRKPCEVESSSVNMGGSTTHTVTASFETPFEVDKEVAAAVKIAFIRLANSPSALDKDEHGDLLRRISQNPDMDEAVGGLAEYSSGCELDTRSEMDTKSLGDGFNSQIIEPTEDRLGKSKSRQLNSISSTKLIDIMLERLKCLQEDELASLATIVATCGLNAVLLEVENSKHHDSVSRIDFTIKESRAALDYSKHGQTRNEQVVPKVPSLDKVLVKHMSRLEREVQEAKNSRKNDLKGGSEGNPEGLDMSCNTIMPEAVPDLGSILVKHASKLEKEIEVAKKTCGKEFEVKPKQFGKVQADVPDLPSLDKFLVKHVSKLEREVQEARNSRKNDSKGVSEEGNTEVSDMSTNTIMSEAVSDLGSILVKHASKLQKEIEVAKKTNGKEFEVKPKHLGKVQADVPDLPSLDKFLVKNVSKFEREVQEAKNRRKNDPTVRSSVSRPNSSVVSSEDVAELPGMDNSSCEDQNQVGKENIEKLASQNQVDECKHSKTRREERERESQKAWGGLSLGHSVRTRPSKLEQEKAAWMKEDGKKKVANRDSVNKNSGESLDQILVKHQSRLEKEKSALQHSVDEIKPSRNRREARERELQEAWGGLSLGNSVRPHVSRLERDKAAWIKAEKEERNQAREELET